MDLIERPADDVRRHPWELARARFFIRLLGRLGLLESTDRWLDVGAGDAWFDEQLRGAMDRDARLVCWDVNYTEAQLRAGFSEHSDIVLTADKPTGSFHGVLMLDVIEHVEDDAALVGDVVGSLLSDDGWLLVSVPAYQALFSDHDRMLKHYRRYSPGDLRAVLERCGLRIVARGGLFHSLLAVRGAQVLMERRRGAAKDQHGVGAWQGSAGRSRRITAVLGAEARVSLALGARNLPVVPGLSTWAVCRRRAAGGA
jgi:hypothetical protein